MENEEKLITNETSEQSRPEWEDKLETMMRNAYLAGLSKGGKTFVGLIYEMILEDRSKKSNPAKTVLRIEATCKKMLDMEDYKMGTGDSVNE